MGENAAMDYAFDVMGLVPEDLPSSEVRRIKDTEDIVESSTTRMTNLDILKRLSSLEKTVYGKNDDIS